MFSQYQEIEKSKQNTKSILQKQVEDFLGLSVEGQEEAVKDLKHTLDVKRKNLFNKYTGTKMLFNVLNNPNVKSYGLNTFVKSFSNYIVNPYGNPKIDETKNKNIVDLINAIQKIVEKTSGNDASKLKEIVSLTMASDTKNVNLGQFLLGYISKYSKDENSNEEFTNGVDMDTFTRELKDILSKDKYYFNATPEGNSKEDKILGINSTYLDNYEIKTMIEMPRALINLEQTLNNPIVEDLPKSSTEVIELAKKIDNTLSTQQTDHELYYEKHLSNVNLPIDLIDKLKILYSKMNIDYDSNNDTFEISIGIEGQSIDDLHDSLMDLMMDYTDYTDELNDLDNNLNCVPF